MQNTLEVKNASKRFGKVVTAENISFSVPSNSALGIVGPNGAGKSTLLSLITGVFPLDSGSISFEGRDVTSMSPGARSQAGVARTFQIPRPFVDMSVFENVYVGAAFGADKHGKPGYQSTVQALEVTGLMHLANEPARKLRLLDLKRLELARALATDPKLILLDEIAGGLTERELPELIALIHNLVAQGMTVIWIEHIVHALLEVVDQLMCLAAGEVLAYGVPREVMANPAVVEVYLGSTFDLGNAS